LFVPLHTPGELVEEKVADGDDELEPPPPIKEDEVEKEVVVLEAEEEGEKEEKQEEKKKKSRVLPVSCADEDEEALIRWTRTGRRITPKPRSSVEGYY